MSDTRRETGQRGEALARRHLVAAGYVILEANYRASAGEIDLVARQGDAVVFVEVRTRRSRRFGTPQESITPRKRAHLTAAALEYLQTHGLAEAEWRIDVVAIEEGPRGTTRLEVIENAVVLP